MKKLTRNEMKLIFGGVGEETDEIGEAGCPAACTGTKASNYQGGSCSSAPMPGGTTCVCSVSGGSGCI